MCGLSATRPLSDEPLTNCPPSIVLFVTVSDSGGKDQRPFNMKLGVLGVWLFSPRGLGAIECT